MPNVPDLIVLTREQVRTVDQWAIERLGIPGIVLMENAGRNAANAILGGVFESGRQPRDVRALVLCGGGNNGGDGYVIARHLANAGMFAVVGAFKAEQELPDDARTNAVIARNMGLAIQRLDLSPRESVLALANSCNDTTIVVDALLGTGFAAESVRAPADAGVELCHAARANGSTVVAIDVPSGLDCDTGAPAEPCVRADLTVTFVAPKVGFDADAAKERLGRVLVADIGAPPDLARQVVAADEGADDAGDADEADDAANET